MNVTICFATTLIILVFVADLLNTIRAVFINKTFHNIEMKQTKKTNAYKIVQKK